MSCILAANITSGCNQNEFACLDELNTCLDRSTVCDGFEDCSNGKDEDDSICKCTSDQVSFSIDAYSKNCRKTKCIKPNMSRSAKHPQRFNAFFFTHIVYLFSSMMMVQIMENISHVRVKLKKKIAHSSNA